MSTCCGLHGRNCEPPGDLCCAGCTEVAHPGHGDGSECYAPDLSGLHPGGLVPGLDHGVRLMPEERLLRADGTVLRWTGSQWVGEAQRWR